MSDRKFKRGDLGVVIGIFAFFTLCIGTIYLVTGVLVGGEGFKGIVLGAVVGFIAFVFLNAAAGRLARRVSSARARSIQSGSIIFLTLIFIFFFVLPLLRKDPSSYYTGAPAAQYQVKYDSGRQEIKTGAQLGIGKWEFAAGTRVAIAAIVLVLAVSGIFRRVGAKSGGTAS